MFVVAYLMIFHRLSCLEARSLITNELWIARQQEYDRNRRFDSFLQFLEENEILKDFKP
jgi:hypothetical protein